MDGLDVARHGPLHVRDAEPVEPAVALDRLSRALGDFAISGLTTNIAFLRALIDHPQVRAGNMDTGLIERELAGWLAGE